jgi:nicotinamide-nucleotide amidase
MSAPDGQPGDASDVVRLAADLGRAASERGLTIAVAESLTGGSVAAALSAAPDASTWFKGGIVAYMSEVKHRVLGVRPGPVVSEGAALDMAAGVVALLKADLGLAVTGVGGPDPQDGREPGTVWFAVDLSTRKQPLLRIFEGDPADVVAASRVQLLELGLDALS